jgi:hypothetical protein
MPGSVIIMLPVELAQVEVKLMVGVGNAFTVSAAEAVLEHVPLLNVYTTVTVPAVRPVTTPPAVILAVPVPANIDHVPPIVASENAGVNELTQTAGDPPSTGATAGNGFIVMF